MTEITAATAMTAALAAMARNSTWANHRLLTACCRLSQAEFVAERTGFFPSIRETLEHIYLVDCYYIDSLEDRPLAWDTRKAPPTDTAPLLMAEQARSDRRLIAFCDALSNADLMREVGIVRDDYLQKERIDRVLLHLFQHQIHHRGQAHAMLAATPVAPPQLDEFFLADEASLRADEFRELGWDPEKTWP